jgi:drug/metabolite transporter (DMT)-like permease
MLLPLYILFIEGITPVLLKLYLTVIPYDFILLLSQILTLLFISIYVFIFKSNKIKEGYVNLNYKLLFIIIIISFFSSFLARILFLKVINDNDKINIFLIIMSLYPIITIIASYFLLKEEITNRQLFGYLLIIIGIYFLLYNVS